MSRMGASQIQTDSLQLQARDLALLRGLFESRVMTAFHISSIYFGGKGEYTKKRLQRLKTAGYIGERKRNANEPLVLFLTRKAFNLLTSEGLLANLPPLGGRTFESRADVSNLTLRHELEIMDVKSAFHVALSLPGKFTLQEFSTWPLLHQFEVFMQRRGNILVKPDGFICVHESEAGSKGFLHECYLEVDRSSETQETLISRAACYLEYYRSGGFAVRNGAGPDKFRDFPFRVLMVLKSAERRNNAAERLAPVSA